MIFFSDINKLHGKLIIHGTKKYFLCLVVDRDPTDGYIHSSKSNLTYKNLKPNKKRRKKHLQILFKFKMNAHGKLKEPPISPLAPAGGLMATKSNASVTDKSPAQIKTMPGVFPLFPMSPFMKG